MAGAYAITGTFDDLPGATVSGPLTLVQADRSSGALSGTVTLTLRTSSGATSTASGLFEATVTTTGNVSFSVGAPTGGGLLVEFHWGGYHERRRGRTAHTSRCVWNVPWAVDGDPLV